MNKETFKTTFGAVDWRSIGREVVSIENPHNRLKHSFADRFGVHVGLIFKSRVGNMREQIVAHALKFSVLVKWVFHSRDLLKKDTDNSRQSE